MMYLECEDNKGVKVNFELKNVALVFPTIVKNPYFILNSRNKFNVYTNIFTNKPIFLVCSKIFKYIHLKINIL